MQTNNSTRLITGSTSAAREVRAVLPRSRENDPRPVKQRSRWPGIIVKLAILLVGLSALVAFFLTSAWIPQAPFMVGSSWEQVPLTAADGTTLEAWYLGNQEQPLVVIAHDYMGAASQAISLAEVLRDLDFAVMSFDFRGHGKSAGLVTHGLHEAQDVEAVLQWLKSERGSLDRVAWIGDRMGAAAFLMAPSAAEISAAVLAAPYDRIGDRFDRWSRAWAKLPFEPADYLVSMFMEMRTGENLKDVHMMAQLDRLAYTPLLVGYAQGQPIPVILKHFLQRHDLQADQTLEARDFTLLSLEGGSRDWDQALAFIARHVTP
jgi:pimeloyl-ACP methyl ester carboxylesterase